MSEKFEKYFPVALSVIVVSILIICNGIFKDLPGLIDKLSDNALGISSTLVGFFLTILTIINAIETRRMQFVQSAGLFPRLLKYLNQSIRANVILIASSFLIKYVEHRAFPWLHLRGRNVFDYLYLFIFILTLLISIRFINIFVRLLSDVKASN